MKDQYEYREVSHGGNPAVYRKQVEMLVALGWEVVNKTPVKCRLRREPPPPPRKPSKSFESRPSRSFKSDETKAESKDMTKAETEAKAESRTETKTGD